MPTIRVPDPDRFIAELRAKGIIVDGLPGVVAVEPDEPTDPPLVEPQWLRVGPVAVFVLPLHTASETNRRDWKARSRRTKAARRAVSAAFGPRLAWVAQVAEAYHRGEPVGVKLTRLGGRRLDPTNLPAALKAVEDSAAEWMGADDGSPLWRVCHGQEPGGAYGVRITLSAENLT